VAAAVASLSLVLPPVSEDASETGRLDSTLLRLRQIASAEEADLCCSEVSDLMRRSLFGSARAHAASARLVGEEIEAP